MALINSEMDLILTCSNRYLIINNPFPNQEATSAITDTKL